MRIKGEQSLVLDTENDEQSSRIKIRIMIIDDSFVPPLICSVSVGEELPPRWAYFSAATTATTSTDSSHQRSRWRRPAIIKLVGALGGQEGRQNVANLKLNRCKDKFARILFASIIGKLLDRKREQDGREQRRSGKETSGA